jgi:DNA-binding LacI/PurR family transcriptional regulator
MSYVGVVVPFAGRWYFDQVLAGAETKAREHGAELRVTVRAPGPGAHREVARHLADLFADPDCVGALSISFDLDAEDARLLAAHDRPVVVVGGRSAHLPSVFIDDIATARLATEHLLSLGHRSVAHLAGYATAPDDFAMRGERVRGYSEAMAAAGLEERSRVVPAMFSREAAQRASRELLTSDDRPTAVFAVADEIALAVVDTAEELGLEVPRDLSVIGVDDHPDAAVRGLTTVRQDPEALGAAAAARLLGETQEDAQRQDVELVVRTTTGGPGVGAAASAAPRRSWRLLSGLRRR